MEKIETKLKNLVTTKLKLEVVIAFTRYIELELCESEYRQLLQTFKDKFIEYLFFN